MNVHFSSECDEWYTPKVIKDKLYLFFPEGIDLDPCSNPDKNIDAKQHYTIKENGLIRPWLGSVFVNPPYGNDIQLWVKKLVLEVTLGNTNEYIVLTASRTDTLWFRDLVRLSDVRLFVTGRLAFTKAYQTKKIPAPFPSILFYYGNKVSEFKSTFGSLGYFL